MSLILPNPGIIAAPSWRGYNCFQVAQKLGLTNGLKLALDAGDAASYSSGQPWLDLSGNGYDFNRGLTNSSEASDPTFNGTAGGLSSGEYFSFDGGDLFTYDSSNETWMENIHKNNAIFSVTMLVYVASAAATRNWFTTRSTGLSGFDIFMTAGAAFVFQITNTSASLVIQIVVAGGFSVGQWHVLNFSLNEAVGSNGCLFIKDGGAAVYNTSTYTSPDATAASGVMSIGAKSGGSGNFVTSGSRIAGLLVWEGVAHGEPEMRAIYNALRGRFNL